jgi:hypothetical protein
MALPLIPLGNIKGSCSHPALAIDRESGGFREGDQLCCFCSHRLDSADSHRSSGVAVVNCSVPQPELRMVPQAFHCSSHIHMPPEESMMMLASSSLDLC